MKQLELDRDLINAGTYALSQIKNEKARRHFLSLIALDLGYGGISAVSRSFHVCRDMISDGIKEIEEEGLFTEGRQRDEGAGRPSFRCQFAKHMEILLKDPSYVYIESPKEIPEDHTETLDTLSESDENSSSNTEAENVSATDDADSDAKPEKKEKRRRSLDIDNIIKKHSEHLRLNPGVIILPDNPTSVEAWINQIVEEQFAAVYGDPASPHMYVNLTVNEIRERFESRTQFKVSKSTMWNTMRDMGFSLHKNMKYEQVGDPHPQRNEQFLYIQSNINDFLKSGDPIFSIDAKAAIKLGCFLMNGRVWCPQYQPPHVLDHDFAFKFKEIYTGGTSLIPPEFMDKRAIIKPYGVYDYTHLLAHITIGISSDTSEFAGDSLLNGWDKFMSLFPSAKRILILSDGGGSNRSTGILWKQECYRLAQTAGLPVMMCHYPPGCSKYDPIEHSVFGPISKNASGSPLLDIERARAFMESTTTKRGLKVTTEMSTKEYLTQEAKKKAGAHIMTQAEFNKLVNITYPNQSGDLAHWNYLITP